MGWSTSGTEDASMSRVLTIPDQPVNSGPATEADMWILWRRLLDHFVWYLGAVPPRERTAAHINQIRSFLVNNGCALNEAHKVPISQQLEQLADLTLPFTGNDTEH